MIRTTLLAAGFIAAACVGSTAYAAQAQRGLSAQDKELLSQLNPETRQEVLARMGGGQTVSGILETMTLNRQSLATASETSGPMERTGASGMQPGYPAGSPQAPAGGYQQQPLPGHMGSPQAPAGGYQQQPSPGRMGSPQAPGGYR